MTQLSGKIAIITGRDRHRQGDRAPLPGPAPRWSSVARKRANLEATAEEAPRSLGATVEVIPPT
ncbi:MAG: hypothetical protein R2873_16830 [Caldilineaceae bacterium]